MTDHFLSTMQLGRYQIQGRIGTGGMARVFKAYDSNLERLVAIKVMHDHLADDPNFKERFEREARFIASFNHPNIVQVYDFDSVDMGEQRIYYMVMPYIPGKTLRDVLDELGERGEHMEHDDVIKIAQNICDALGYAHEQGMVHRDVKPANILFNERKQAVLTDFGIARLVAASKLTQEGLTTGTPAYMSPEQVAGLPVDARSDIYSLGIILYEMLSGQLPFNEENGISIMLKHINAPIPRISQAMSVENTALDAFIYRALAKDPMDRHATTHEFINDLTAALQGKDAVPTIQIAGTPAQPNPTTQVMEATNVLSDVGKPPVALYRSPLGILALGMTLIALISALALFSRQQQTRPISDESPESSGVESMTAGGGFYFDSDFNANSDLNQYWPQDNSGGLRRQITGDGFYQLINPAPGTAATSLFQPAYRYADVSITLEGKLEAASPRNSAYGIVFRYQDSDHYNVFAVDGMGRYSIWVRANGVWRELRGLAETWTPDKAIATIGQPNTLRLDVHGRTLTGYVNDQLVTQAQDETLEPGAIGIYLATPPEGSARALIDRYETVQIPGSVPSMTGG